MRHRPDSERGNRFVRLLQMVELLRRRPLTLRELADEFQVSPRTVFRDINVIERAGALVDLSRIQDEGRAHPTRYRAKLEARP